MLRRTFVRCSILAGSAIAAPLAAAHADFGTAFTYQGRLTDGGAPADGVYDLWFRLYGGPDSIFAIGTAVTLENVQVTDGLFTVKLDFALDINGDSRWMSIGVRPGASSGSYTALSPRQELTPTPYALVADRVAVPLHVGGSTNPDLFG